MRQAFQRANEPADPTAARIELDRAIRNADDAPHLASAICVLPR